MRPPSRGQPSSTGPGDELYRGGLEAALERPYYAVKAEVGHRTGPVVDAVVNRVVAGLGTTGRWPPTR